MLVLIWMDFPFNKVEHLGVETPKLLSALVNVSERSLLVFWTMKVKVYH